MSGLATDNIHVRSFREFISEKLPAALAAVVPLSDYRAEDTGDGVGRVVLSVGGRQLVFDDLPFPLPDGDFRVNGGERVVVMTASSNNLEEAQIKAVGEQLTDEIQPRLTPPPARVDCDEAVLRAWLPLDRWLGEFLLQSETSHHLDTTNAIARATHLRRVWVLGPDVSFHPSHIGRACPFETAEGPNCGRVLTLALGARVENGRIVPAADREHGALGLSASLVPFLAHDDSNRALMGVNMIRQSIPQESAEPPLVQTGLEPKDGSAFTAANFLTAFMPWKGMNDEDGIVISKSAAARLGTPHPLQVGDKLSNRHGTKGVVGAVLPDDEMPHLPDGRAVDLVFDSIALHTRLNFGQVIEGMFGLIAEKKGQPIIAGPLRRVTSDELRTALRDAGLPESGQFTLRDGKDGPELDEPTTVGVVYWHKLVHTVDSKIHALGAGPKYSIGRAWNGSEWVPWRAGQRTGEMEYLALRTVGAHENIVDAYFTRSTIESDEHPLAERARDGFLPAFPEPPSAEFRRVQRALRAAMIDLSYARDRVSVAWAKPAKGDLPLAEPVPHPWQPEVPVTHVGPAPAGVRSYADLVAANERLAQSLRSGAHPTAQDAARGSLRRAVQALLDEIDPPWSAESPFSVRTDVDSCLVRFSANSRLTGRSVLAPGYDLRLGEVGLPEDMAWTFYAPLIASKASESEVASRSAKARRALESVMRESAVVVNRAPTLEATSITAFTPVIRPGLSIRLHPLCCRMFNADFDGDQAAVWLPISRPAQQEAKEKLTILGHLKRDPGVVLWHLAPATSVMLGLAYASENEEGRAELASSWPADCPSPESPLARSGLVARLMDVYEKLGAEKTLAVIEALYHLGVRWATRSGSSLSPFVGQGLRLPAAPTSSYAASWSAYCATVEAEIAAHADGDATMRPVMRRVNCGARGSLRQVRALVASWGVADPYDPNPPIAHGFRDGLTAEELWVLAARGRAALQAISRDHRPAAAAGAPSAEATVLRRAMSAERPGPVFAEAAGRNETDPLTDRDVRLWVGLLP